MHVDREGKGGYQEYAHFLVPAKGTDAERDARYAQDFDGARRGKGQWTNMCKDRRGGMFRCIKSWESKRYCGRLLE